MGENVHKKQSVYTVASSNKHDRLLLDVNLYNITDHYKTTKYPEPVNDRRSRLHNGIRRCSANGNQLAASTRNDSNPTLLEQSMAFQGLRKHISKRLSDSGSTPLKTAKPGPQKETSPMSGSKKLDAGLSTASGYDIQFLRNRGTHVRLTESPKEAIVRVAQQITPGTLSKSPSSVARDATKYDTCSNELVVTGVVSNTIPDEDEIRKSDISSYAIRQQYGQHLEQNWYKSQLREMNAKHKDGILHQYPYSTELFYSPEPDSDEYGTEEYEHHDDIQRSLNDNLNNTLTESSNNIMNVEINSTLKTQSAKFASMDVLLSDGDSHDDSDVEFILKNGQLIQRHVQNKMHKIRTRKQVRFQRFLTDEHDSPKNEDEVELNNISDIELRAMRLKLKKPTWKLKLKGIARFRQVVNSILVLMYFSRRLKRVRRERRARARRNKRHQSLGGFDSGDEEYDIFSRQHHRYKNLKERFLCEIGWKLMEQVAELAIQDDIRDELASGERISRSMRVLEEWFPVEPLEHSVTEINVGERRKIKRSFSCPEFVKPKEFRVLLGNEVHNKGSKNGSKKKPKSSLHKSKARRTAKGNKNKFGEYYLIDNDDERKMVGVHNFGRRNSLDTKQQTNGGLPDLRDLLKDVHIPAKEIKIQIAERKLRRQKTKKSRGTVNFKKQVLHYDAKRAMEANRFKIPELDLDILNPKEPSTMSVCEPVGDMVQVNEVKDKSDMFQSFSIQNGPCVNKCIPRNHSKPKGKYSWTKRELDKEIEKAGSLFLEIRHCRYIRWDRLGQAMVTRMAELENEAF